MKVLVVNNVVPFAWGGAEHLAINLQENLIIAGHDSEVLRIPFQCEPSSQIPSQMLMVRAFELWNVDKVIALKFPAFYIRHPDKTLWLLPQCRQAYDMGDFNQTLPSRDEDDDIRALIHKADNEAFVESKRIFAGSEGVRQRIRRCNGFEATLLLPPVNDPELFKCGRPGDYVFAGGRVNGAGRQHLLLEAMAHAGPNVRLIIAGPPDSPADSGRLEQTVERLGLTDRVKLDLRVLQRETYAEYVVNAAAVAYLPLDEDPSYCVDMEAASAAKALITTSDCGGVLALAKEGVTGWVVEPAVVSLADAMDSAFADTVLTRSYGCNARDLLNSLYPTWPKIVESLLQ